MYSQWQAQHMAPQLTQAEREFRDRFVSEYLLDYSPVEACIRLGFAKEYANEYSHTYMLDGYVQREIKRRELEENVANVNTDEALRKRIKASLFREAHNQFAKPSSRVAALKVLADIYGMNAPVKTESTVRVESNVKFYLPDNGRDRKAPLADIVEDAVQTPPEAIEDAVVSTALAAITFPARDDSHA